MGPRPHAVSDRMGRLAGIADLGQALSDQSVELVEACAWPAVVDRAPVHAQKARTKLLVGGCEVAGAEVLRVVAPVAVGADPDLEQRRLVLLHRPVAGRREGPDAFARPHEREAQREIDLALPAGALAVDEAVPQRSGLALLHPGT